MSTSGLVLPGVFGSFINAGEGHGWECNVKGSKGWLFPKTLYTFRLLYPDPLTWIDRYGCWQPNRYEEETDLGTVPPPVSLFVPRDYTIRSFVYHDSCWKHGGLWFCETPAGPFRFVPMTLRAGNDLLGRQLPSEGCDPVRRRLILSGVETGRIWRRITT